MGLVKAMNKSIFMLSVDINVPNARLQIVMIDGGRPSIQEPVDGIQRAPSRSNRYGRFVQQILVSHFHCHSSHVISPLYICNGVESHADSIVKY